MRNILILTLASAVTFLFSCQKITVNDLNNHKTENISAFAKLYGYVRFFYPGDEAAKVDWDKFAIYGVKRVEDAKDSLELKQKLKEIFSPVAPLLKIYDKNESIDDKPYIPSDTAGLSVVIYKHYGVSGIGNLNTSYNIYKSVRGINRMENDTDIFKPVQQFPAPGELFKSGIGSSITISMPLALYRDSDGTLPHFDSTAAINYAANPNNAIPADITAKDKYVRLADIVIAWNIFQHFYPYFDVVKVDWNAELHNALINALNDKSEYDFLNTLKMLTAKLNDGHIHVKHASDIYHYYYPPFCWQWIENKLVVTYVPVESESKLKLGDVVAEINDISSADAVAKEKQYVSGATEQWKMNSYIYSGSDNVLMRLLSGDKDTEMKLKLIRDDKSLQVILKRNIMSLEIPDNSPSIEEKQPGVFYVDLTRLTDIEFIKSLGKFINAKGIIFNMRGYPGKMSPVFLQYLTKTNIKSARWMVPINLYPDQIKTYYNTEGIWNLEPKSPHFDAKIAFITDGRAISYSESVMGIVEYYKLGEIIGEPTAGTNGNINIMSLPGGYSITWTGMKVLKHDGSQHHGLGIQPTIPVPRTIQSVKEGRDIQLEKAIEVVSK